MSRESNVIERISNSLRIDRGRQEDGNLWKARVIYSAAGRIALASLWDVPEDEQSISITHFKRRAEREIKALTSSSIELEKIFIDNIEAIVNEIYEIYINTGYMYHTSNHIEPIPDIITPAGKYYLLRGCALQENIYMSGLGLYGEASLENKYTEASSVNELFQIPQMSLTNYIEKLLSYAEWNEFRFHEHVEFLKMKPPFTGGYWSREEDRSGLVSLLRIGQPGSYIYYLYKYGDGGIEVSSLPQWMTDKFEYRQIACCLLSRRDMLPATVYWNDGELTHFHIGYLYPPRIQSFLKLYSWPEFMNHFPSDFRRVMTKEVFDVCRTSIEALGYSFIKR